MRKMVGGQNWINCAEFLNKYAKGQFGLFVGKKKSQFAVFSKIRNREMCTAKMVFESCMQIM